MPAIRSLITELNSLGVGSLDAIQAKLRQCIETLEGIGHPELVERLEEGSRMLAQGDLPGFRKAVNHVVSKLGHIKE